MLWTYHAQPTTLTHGGRALRRSAPSWSGCSTSSSADAPRGVSGTTAGCTGVVRDGRPAVPPQPRAGRHVPTCLCLMCDQPAEAPRPRCCPASAMIAVERSAWPATVTDCCSRRCEPTSLMSAGTAGPVRRRHLPVVLLERGLISAGRPAELRVRRRGCRADRIVRHDVVPRSPAVRHCPRRPGRRGRLRPGLPAVRRAGRCGACPNRRDSAWSAISSGTGVGRGPGRSARRSSPGTAGGWSARFDVVAVAVGVAARRRAAGTRSLDPSSPRPQLSWTWFVCPRSRPLLLSAVLVGTRSAVLLVLQRRCCATGRAGGQPLPPWFAVWGAARATRPGPARCSASGCVAAYLADRGCPRTPGAARAAGS